MSEFIFPLDILNAICLIVIIDKVVRQDNLEFLSIVTKTINGTIPLADSNFMSSQCLDIMDLVEICTF